MNKQGLIEAVAARTGLSKKDSDKAITAMVETVRQALCEGEKVQLVGFGSFETKTRMARKARNPRTKEVLDLPAQRVPVFKAGAGLKRDVAVAAGNEEALLVESLCD